VWEREGGDADKETGSQGDREMKAVKHHNGGRPEYLPA